LAFLFSAPEASRLLGNFPLAAQNFPHLAAALKIPSPIVLLFAEQSWLGILVRNEHL
jgi:hypothetical protein